jgi:hypothetical protein
MVDQNRLARDLESREATQRKQNWVPPQMLPDPNPRPGWAHRWIRVSLLGQADPTNVSAKFREGWEPVKASDYPEVMYMAGDSTNSRFKDNVEIGGLVLCKAPEAMVKQRADFYNRQAQGQMEAVDNNLMRQNDPRMPLFKERRSETSFGSGKK